MKHNNVLAFKVKDDADQYNKDIQLDLNLWVQFVGANTMNAEGVLFARSLFPIERQAGAWYYHLEKENLIEHCYGIDEFQHYVKVTKLWLDSINNSVEITDEEGEIIVTDILNRQVYNVTKENTTHGLIKLTDSNFRELQPKIQYRTIDIYGTTIDNYPINLVCSDKFYEAINEGGEFYTIPNIEE